MKIFLALVVIRKGTGKEKNINENNFLTFGFTMKNIKKNLNIIKILHIFKFFSSYII